MVNICQWSVNIKTAKIFLHNGVSENTEKPKPSGGGLDGDITKVGDKYHLYYVSDAKGGGMHSLYQSAVIGAFLLPGPGHAVGAWHVAWSRNWN